MKYLLVLTVWVTLLFGAIDINTANKEELASLKGIGEKKATKIIEYRKTKCFNNVKELKKVKGMKKKDLKKILKKNKDNIIASECKVSK